MGYEKDVLSRARTRYFEHTDNHKKTVRERQERVYREIPELKTIDRQLSATMAQVMALAFRQGDDPKEAVEQVRRENQSLQNRRQQLLSAAGYGENYLDDGPLCRKCSDTGYVGKHICSCFEKFCQEEQRKELTSLLSSQESDFDDFNLNYYSTVVDPTYGVSPREQMEIVYETAVDYARKFSLHSRSLLMNGGTGLGKTFLSACIARAVVEKGYSVVYDSAISLFSCLEKQKFGSATEEELKMAQRIFDADLLILDDLGTEMNTAFIPSALYSIVNGRILSGKPTIISSNLSMGELGRRYSPQIASRLMGEYVNLVFLGSDIRLQRK